jgi:hypothetical protein
MCNVTTHTSNRYFNLRYATFYFFQFALNSILPGLKAFEVLKNEVFDLRFHFLKFTPV